jgi:hypothetical protein
MRRNINNTICTRGRDSVGGGRVETQRKKSSNWNEYKQCHRLDRTRLI